METYLMVMIVVALFCGAIDTFAFSVQNKQLVMEGGISKKFYHPYMQLAMRYVSNFLILIIYLVQIKLEGGTFGKKQSIQSKDKKEIVQNEQRRSNWDYLLILIPTFLDVVANLGFYIALNFITASVYQMLRGGILIATYFMSNYFLNTKFTKYRSAGCIIIFIGLLIIGVINLIYATGTASQQQYTLMGYGLILFSIFVNALHYIYEEYLAVNYKFQPFLIIGIEGIYGILMALIYIPVFSAINCFFKQEACVIQDSGREVVEDFSIWLHEVTTNPILMFTVILVLFTMAIYNAFGITISKYARALTRSTIDVSRSVIIWIVGILFTVTIGTSNSQFIFQSIVPQQIVGQVLGFVILVIGNIIYYQAIKFECLEQEKTHSLIQEQSF